jgi:hypothetical protein
MLRHMSGRYGLASCSSGVTGGIMIVGDVARGRVCVE